MVVTHIVICKVIIKVHPRKCKGHRHVSMWGASNLKDSPGGLGFRLDGADFMRDLSGKRMEQGN